MKYKPEFAERVKQETWEEHEASKDQPFAVEIMAGNLDKNAYIQWILGLLPVYRSLEAGLRANRDDYSIYLFDHRKLDRTEKIESDLTFWRVDPFTTESPLPEAKIYHETVQSAVDSGSPQRILAHHYTRYMGDMIGGQVVSRQLQKMYGMPVEGLQFYDFSDIGDIYHYRKTYKSLYDLIPWDNDERDEFVAEAKKAYLANSKFFEALYPLALSVKGT